MKTSSALRTLGLPILAAALVGAAAYLVFGPEPAEEETRTVSGRMQARPGGPLEEVTVAVHQVPTDLPIVPADKAQLKDDDLVLGVETDGRAVAFPIRYLAMYEVVDSRVGPTPVAPTW